MRGRLKSRVSFVWHTCTPLLPLVAILLVGCPAEGILRQVLGQGQMHPSQSLQNQTAIPAQINSQSSCINWEGFPHGNEQAQLHYWQQVLADCRRLRDRAGESQVLLILGGMYFFAEDYRAAIDAYQLAEQVDASKGAALNGLGRSYLAVGDHARALDAYKQAVQLTGPAPELHLLQAEAFRGMGLTYLDLKDYGQAIAVLQDALKRLQKHGSPTLGESNWIGIFASLGLAHYRSGHLKEAERYLREALSASSAFVSEFESGWDSIREGVQRERRQRFSASKSPQELVLSAIGSLLGGGPVGVVDSVIGSLLKTKERQAAVQAYNQYRDESLRKLAQESLESAQGTLETFALMAAVSVEVYVCPLLQEILAAQHQLAEGLEIAELCRGRALAQRLGYHLGGDGGTKMNQPLTFAQIQAIANEQQATLVEYTILYEPSRLPPWFPEKESGLLIWGVSPSGQVTQRRVDLRTEHAGGAETLAERVAMTRQALGARGLGMPSERPSGAPASAHEDRARRHPRLQQLYTLLIQPIADMLPPDPEARIIFVPQDSLFLVPFAALQDPMGTYLVERHTISVTPSIQTLAFTHRQGQVHRAVESPAEAALIIGNPSMPNYVVSPDQAPQPLPALPGAEEEAKGIAAFLHTEPLTGSQATKAAFLSRVSQATLIHLATHGLLDPDYKDDLRSAGGSARSARFFGAILARAAAPGQIHMPGALALAPANGDSGLLTGDEIARLKTHAAHVVLSACDTGRGVISDDGVIGLSRAWIVAGVPTVIVSLWSVPDAPTSALMLEFYRQLAQGADKAQALRRAMLTILQHHPDPLDWAAFTLIGEAA